MKNFLPFRTRLYFFQNKNFLTNFAMQLLIFFSFFATAKCVKKRSRLIDSLNIITFTKKIVKRFFQAFSIFFNFFHFFQKSCFLYLFRKKRSLLDAQIITCQTPVLYIICRESTFCAKKTRPKACFLSILYLQPLHVLQFPEHFLLGLPVAEYISPE